MATTDETIYALAVTQHGVVTRSQARTAGLSEYQVRNRVQDQDWSKMGPGAFLVRAAASETDPNLTPLMAGCLILGGLASHRSAAWLWGVVTEPGLGPDITVSRQRYHRRTGVNVYSTTQMELAGRTIMRGIPTTGIERTLIDMGTQIQSDQLSDLVGRAVELGLTNHLRLKRAGQAHSQRGRAGVSRFRQVLDEAA